MCSSFASLNDGVRVVELEPDSGCVLGAWKTSFLLPAECMLHPISPTTGYTIGFANQRTVRAVLANVGKELENDYRGRHGPVTGMVRRFGEGLRPPSERLNSGSAGIVPCRVFARFRQPNRVWVVRGRARGQSPFCRVSTSSGELAGHAGSRTGRDGARPSGTWAKTPPVAIRRQDSLSWKWCSKSGRRCLPKAIGWCFSPPV